MKTVLHVLPHPGGGGETYVDYLDRLEGYNSERTYVAPSPNPSPRALYGGVRAQLRARRYDVLHVHGEVASALSLPALAIRASVVTLHGLHLLRRTTSWRRAVASANLNAVIHAASATICVSEAERADLEEALGGRGRGLHVIRNGVDPRPATTPEDRAASRAELGLDSDHVVAVMVGSLDERKDPMLAARAAAEVGDPFVLLIAGQGPLRPTLERFADRHRTVRLLGYRRDVDRLLTAADVFVLSSWVEGSSYALLEAMSAGIVPVVSDAPGNPEAVGDTGLVVTRGNQVELTNAFKRLQRDAEQRRTLGERARDRAGREFRSEEMIKETGAVYERVLSVRH